MRAGFMEQSLARDGCVKIAAMANHEKWLRLTYEEPLEPGLPICDAHHHLWDHGPEDRYLVEQLIADIDGGHDVVSTVHVDCFMAYRKDGPEEMKPVGETEWVESVTSGLEGKT